MLKLLEESFYIGGAIFGIIFISYIPMLFILPYVDDEISEKIWTYWSYTLMVLALPLSFYMFGVLIYTIISWFI
ncbi:MAG: hypothetical protein VXV77_04720 [Bacteroidota bacterium]|nr:hypothetical protein [Bacteroidota bacterium]